MQTKYCYETLELKVHHLYQLIDQISMLNSTVLIAGASGTGKESVCALLHMKSPRADKPLMPINCAAIPEDLIETELFGHQAGSFTGAYMARTGKFELAGEGTIVLDEISEMNLKTQAKILRAIEAREFFKIGGSTPIKLKARILATTNKNLLSCIENKTFREDLFYRLDVMRVEVPSLNDRAKDIPLLTDFFLNSLIEENHKTVSLSPEIYHFLCQKKWEGNIRELRNFVTRLFYLAKDNTLTVHDLYNEIAGFEMAKNHFIVSSNTHSLNEVEKKYILHTMNQVNGNKSQAARTLKISLKTLRSKLREYDYKDLNAAFLNYHDTRDASKLFER